MRATPGRSSRLVRRAALVTTCAVAAWGCAVVAGVDFDGARLAADADEAGAPSSSGGTDGAGPSTGRGPASDGGTLDEAGCRSDQKTCNGACVGKDAPEFGCGAVGCEPCSLALTTGSVCVPDGGCAPSGCEQGFADCDGDPANGCEADLTRPETCGSCGNACSGGQLCSPGGCVLDCTAPLVACGGACVDTTSSVAHCGKCDQACPSALHADPKCVGGACQIACRTGYADCANDPAKTCTALPKWFKDADGDGHGSATVKTACTKPAGYVASGGDCLDSNASVHPGAGAQIVAYGGPVGPSYDYDCNGVEEEVPPAAKYSGSCGAFCNGPGGAIPLAPPRAGTGVDDYCGSPNVHICADLSGIGGGCLSTDYDAGTPIACK